MQRRECHGTAVGIEATDDRVPLLPPRAVALDGDLQQLGRAASDLARSEHPHQRVRHRRARGQGHDAAERLERRLTAQDVVELAGAFHVRSFP